MLASSHLVLFKPQRDKNPGGGVWNLGKNADSRVGSMILHFQTSLQVMQRCWSMNHAFHIKVLGDVGLKRALRKQKRGTKIFPKNYFEEDIGG